MVRKLLVPLYFFLGGIAGGSYAIGALVSMVREQEFEPFVRVAYSLAFPLIVVSSFLLILDLTRPLRFWRLLAAFQPTSPVSLGSWALLAFGLISFISFTGLFTGDLQQPMLSFLARSFAPLRDSLFIDIFGLCLGLYVASYTGVLLSASSRPLWNSSPWLGGCFLASALATALAVLLVLITESGNFAPGLDQMLLQSETTLIIFHGVLTLLFFRGVLAQLGMKYPGVRSLIRGPLAPLTAGFFLFGLLIPLALFGRAPGTPSTEAVFFGASSVLAGNLLFRYAIFWSEE